MFRTPLIWIALAVAAGGCHADIGTSETERALALECGDEAVACGTACFDNAATPDDLADCLEVCEGEFGDCAPVPDQPGDIDVDLDQVRMCVGDAAVCLSACSGQLASCDLHVVECDLSSLRAALECIEATGHDPHEIANCLAGVDRDLCHVDPVDRACFAGAQVCFEVCGTDLGTCLD